MESWWWLAQHVVSTGLLVAAVALISRPLRTRPALVHALWVVVLIKFLMPPLVAWPWSLDRLVAIKPTPVKEPPRPNIELPPLDPVELPLTSPPVGEVWVAPVESSSGPVLVEQDVSTVEALQPFVPEPAAIAASDWVGQVAIGTWLLGAWLIGSLVVATIQARKIWRHRAIVRQSRPAPAHLIAEVQRQAAALGVRPVSVLVTQAIDSPCLSCAGPMRLLWPERLCEPAAVERCRGIILHELAHVRRRDHWVAWLDLAAGIVWWFHPLVWFARRRMREAAEMACDAVALSVLPSGRFSYAEAFLQISAHSNTFAPTPALGVSSETPAAFERRLTMILSDQVVSKLTRWGRFAVVALAVVSLPAWSLGQAAAPSDATEAIEPAAAAAPPVEPTESNLAAAEEPTERKSPADDRAQLEARLQKIENALERILKRLDGGGGKSALEPVPVPRTARIKVGDELTGLQAGNRRYAIKQEDRGPVLLAIDAPTQKTVWQTDLADPLAKLPETGGGAKWQITRSDDGKQLHAHAAGSGPVLTIAIDSETGRILQVSIEARKSTTPVAPNDPNAPSAPLAAPVPVTPKPPRTVPSLPAVAAPPAAANPLQPPVVAPSPAAAPTVSNSFGTSGRMPELDLVNLATAYIDAMGSLKLAKSRYAQLEKVAAGNAVSKSELDAAAIQLETAEQKATLLASVAQTALEAARSELTHFEKLIAKGYAPQSSGSAATAKVKLLETILNQGKKETR